MGLLMNRHVRIQQIAQMKKKIEGLKSREEVLEREIEVNKGRVKDLENQLLVQEKAAKKQLADEKKAAAALEKSKKARNKKAEDTPRIHTHPDAKKGKGKAGKTKTEPAPTPEATETTDEK